MIPCWMVNVVVAMLKPYVGKTHRLLKKYQSQIILLQEDVLVIPANHKVIINGNPLKFVEWDSHYSTLVLVTQKYIRENGYFSLFRDNRTFVILWVIFLTLIQFKKYTSVEEKNINIGTKLAKIYTFNINFKIVLSYTKWLNLLMSKTQKSPPRLLITLKEWTIVGIPPTWLLAISWPTR